ncbi:MAG: hypothetical protein RDV41_12930, partial [Planctomycetota bacterium]|nr:hypothetical protein [Planctomycetota bacterium]
MNSPAEVIEPYLATTAELLIAEGMNAAADLLRSAASHVEETGYDNWNGGITLWTVYLTVPPSTYAKLGDKREVIEEQISKRLKTTIERHSDDWYGVKITPQIEAKAN